MRSSQEAYPQLTHERLNPMGSAKSFPVWTARCGQKVKVLLVNGGYKETTPAALVYKATWAEEEAYLCTIETLYDVSVAHRITKTALILVGDAIAHQHYSKSRLYAPDFSTEYRKRKEFLRR